MTYSIVARDDRSGELGVAVQSHYFGVGSLVSWAEAGVGAIATQSVADPAYGQRGLELMRAGASAPEALHRLLAEDRQEPVRQVAFIDKHGRVATHTGARCIREAGHRVADGVSAQANIMERPTVPDAMVAAFRSAGGDLADRMVVALEAAEGEGATFAAASPPPWSWSRRGRPAAPPRTGSSTSAWTTTRTRWPSCAACSA